MRQRDDGDAVEVVALADALRERREAEAGADREPADGDDEPRPQQLQLPAVPERAQLALARRRCAVTAARRSATGIATRHRRAVERRVEGVLVQLEPAAQRLPGAPAPWQALLPLDDPGRLPVHVRALVRVRRAHLQRLGRAARRDAGPAAGAVALARGDRPVRWL